ncbi:DHHC palmitoyltransferase-domain-containing protein [Mycotypha africana]|uniref:DHHC palmitoyltransferase-domain-containing protein n=1 Tax=Mycotypha africana TaxID=64632 RepID=UPI002300E890|nr:DHHC palmitoyltransferase-domain-containing protein [Mycotypha africana]KAI8979273.1 DHHC palmitoyltransferase-domain-containing protein [Mycotypha africana]
MSVLETIPEKYIVLFVTLFITFLQLTANFYILGPALGGWFSLRAQKVLSPLTISLVSLYVNYYLACKTSPGYVPEGWEPPKELLEYDEELPVGYTGPRFCKKCDSYKPPRAHHCRHCGRCILRMDHHCPWIGNCVGFGNYAYFVRFVFSVEISCTYGIYLLLWRLQRILEAWNNMWVLVKPSLREAMLSIFVIVCAGIVTLAVGVLAIYHTYCLIKGQTTIEGSERTKTKRLIRRGKIYPVVFPFDVGFYQNICDVLGNNPLLWWWPSPCPGDGISYHVKPHTGNRNKLDKQMLITDHYCAFSQTLYLFIVGHQEIQLL